MPEIFREDGYRFFFFSLEGTEPPHVHVKKQSSTPSFGCSPLLSQNHAG